MLGKMEVGEKGKERQAADSESSSPSRLFVTGAIPTGDLGRLGRALPYCHLPHK